jgi:CDGSH-type Zn-finger protein
MTTKKNQESRHDKYSMKISKNGPYLVSGGIPLLEKIIKYDSKWDTCEWQDGKTYPRQDQYALCRCGQSHNKPLCDGTHLKVKFDGIETASHALVFVTGLAESGILFTPRIIRGIKKSRLKKPRIVRLAVWLSTIKKPGNQ